MGYAFSLCAPARCAAVLRDAFVRRAAVAPVPPSGSPVRPAWEALGRGDAPAAAAMARLVSWERLPPAELAAWRGVARAAAVRTGDRELLRSANAFRGSRAAAETRLVRDAARWRRAGAEALAQEALARVTAPHLLDEATRALLRSLRAGKVPEAEGDAPGEAPPEPHARTAEAAEFLLAGEPATARAILRPLAAREVSRGQDGYRYLSLLSHLERLGGDASAERAALEALLDHVGAWAVGEGWGKGAADPKDRAEPPATLTKWWAGTRYAELLATQGTEVAAAAARDAEQRLAGGATPAASAALTLRLAFALEAAGNPAARDALLKALPWSASWPASIAAYP